MCYTTVYRGINSLTLTYTTRDSCITYKSRAKKRRRASRGWLRSMFFLPLLSTAQPKPLLHPSRFGDAWRPRPVCLLTILSSGTFAPPRVWYILGDVERRRRRVVYGVFAAPSLAPYVNDRLYVYIVHFVGPGCSRWKVAYVQPWSRLHEPRKR